MNERNMEIELEERLIKEVKKYEFLYNLNHADYKNIEKKEAVWREIAQALNSTPYLTKRKWRNIRDYFNQIKRVMASRSAAARRRKWKHWESCSFLNAVSKTRPTIGYIPSDSEETPPSPLTPSESEAVSTLNSTPSSPVRQIETEFEFEERLIKEVKKHECLYNLNHSGYKKIERKEAVWRKVAKKLNSTPALTKRKWRSIRHYFYQIKRAENLPSGSSRAKTKKWKHLESCSFLNAVPKTCGMLGYVPSESTEFKFEERLIKEVKKHECLYNLCHSDYKNIERKEAVWRAIARALNSKPDLTKRKWRNIRDYFYQIKRAEKLSSGSSADKKKKWKHFESCSFLNAVPKIRSMLRNIPSESEETVPSPLSPYETEAVFTFHSTPSSPAWKKETDEFREFLQCDTDPIKIPAVESNDNSMSSSCFDLSPIKTPCQTMPAVESNDNSMSSSCFDLSPIKTPCQTMPAVESNDNNNNMAPFFNSLAADIVEANLSSADIIEIKMKISSIVYEKIVHKLTIYKT